MKIYIGETFQAVGWSKVAVIVAPFQWDEIQGCHLRL